MMYVAFSGRSHDSGIAWTRSDDAPRVDRRRGTRQPDQFEQLGGGAVVVHCTGDAAGIAFMFNRDRRGRSTLRKFQVRDVYTF